MEKDFFMSMTMREGETNENANFLYSHTRTLLLHGQAHGHETVLGQYKKLLEERLN